jgi:hypothetical protein
MTGLITEKSTVDLHMDVHDNVPTVTHRTNHMTKKRDDKLLGIARSELNVETLETRNMDDLDFHEIGVASLKTALERAYAAGKADAGCMTATKNARYRKSALSISLIDSSSDPK